MDNGAREGRLPYFPMVVEEEFEQDRLVVAYGPYQELSLLGSVGAATSDRDPMVVVAAEIPNRVRPPMTKGQQEMSDLWDLVRREVPGAPADGLIPGPHPNSAPDAILKLPTGVVRLEAAQLHVPATNALGTNMSRWAIFDQIRSSLIMRSAALAGALRQHRGFLIYVWFMDRARRDPHFSLPPRKDPAHEIVGLLRGSRPSATVQRGGRQQPDPAPEDVVAWSGDHSIGVSWGDLPAAYQSPFVEAFGFELGLAGSITFKRSHVRGELHRIIEQHDTAASDVLVVSVNSALRTGLHFPSTQLLSDMLFEDPDPLQGWVPNLCAPWPFTTRE